MDWAVHQRRMLARIGDDASYSHAGGAAVTVRGKFLAPYQNAFDIVAGSAPTFFCEAADLNARPVGDTLTINGVTYTIAAPPQADDTGFGAVPLEAT